MEDAVQTVCLQVTKKSLPVLPQTLWFTYSMKRYISQKWSLKVYYKMIQTCKGFFDNNCQIHVIKHLNVSTNDPLDWTYDTIANQLTKNGCTLEVNKIWVSQRLDFYGYPRNTVSTILQKCFHSDISELVLRSQTLAFNEFIIIAKKLTCFVMQDSNIESSNGQNVSMGDILPFIPKVQFIGYNSLTTPVNFTTTILEATNVKNQAPNLHSFVLDVYDKHIDLDIFFQFVKNHPSVHYKLSCQTNDIKSYYQAAITKNFPNGIIVITEADPANNIIANWDLEYGQTRLTLCL